MGCESKGGRLDASEKLEANVNYTDEQKAIFNFIASGKGNLIVEALAGAGKTSTILESLRALPQKSALLCAFNKRIADELVERMPPAPKGSMYKAQTFHAAGLKILKSQRGLQPLEVKSEATEHLVNDAIKALQDEADRKGTTLKIAFAVRRSAVRLLRTLKETQVDRKLDTSKVTVVGHEYDLFNKLSADDIAKAVSVAIMAYELGLNLAKRTEIDFCDMTWLPVVLDLPVPSRYQAVFVDEAQDLSLPQLQLVKKLVAPGGRLIAVGDRNQQVYSFRGAVGHLVWKAMRDQFGAVSLPLTTTFRCAQYVVAEANALVPALKARPDAPEGNIMGCSFEDMPKAIKNQPDVDTFILSRSNADLLQAALYLWRNQVEFFLAAGKEIVEPLYEIIDRLDKSTKERFAASLLTWFTVEMAKAEAAHASAWADRIEQQYGMLQVMLSYAEPKQFRVVLGAILEPNESPVVLSTVHKAKGLEAQRVYLLKQTFGRHKPREAWMTKPIDQEELNIEYVAITRAKHDLIWVDMPDGMDVLTRVLDLQARDDHEKDDTISRLAQKGG